MKKNEVPISTKNILEWVDNPVSLETMIKIAKKNEEYTVNAVPSFFLVSNFFNSAGEDYIDPCDNSEWKKIRHILAPSEKDFWDFFLEKQHSKFSPIDFLVLNFFLQGFLLNFNGDLILKNGRIPKSKFQLNFALYKILKFVGFPDDPYYYGLVRKSLKKIWKVRMMANKMIEGRRGSYLGSLVEYISDDDGVYSCNIGEWVVILCSSPYSFVNTELQNELKKNELAFQLFNLKQYLFKRHGFFDNNNLLYEFYKRPNEKYADFIKRFRSAMDLLIVKGVVKSYEIKKVKGKHIINILWFGWEKGVKNTRPNCKKHKPVGNVIGCEKHTEIRFKTKKMDRGSFSAGLKLAQKSSFERCFAAAM